MKIHLTAALIGVLFFGSLTTPAVAGNQINPDDSRAEESIMQTAGADNGSEQQSFQTLDSMSSLYEPYLKNISTYKPICFLVGLDPSKSRFQFSFKYRFLNPALSAAKKNN